MTDLDRLHRAILENPADDVARLAYADAMDERGKSADRARAEFVRLQVGKPDPHTFCSSDPADRRCVALLKTWGLKWVPRSGRRVGGERAARVSVAFTSVAVDAFGADHYVFRRGFVGQVEVVMPGPPLGPVGMGTFCRNALSAHPVERVVFAVVGHAPELVATFGPGPAGWGCEIADTEGEVGPWHLAAADRRTLLAALPSFFAGSLADVDFERVRGDDWDEADLADYLPDTDDEILEYGPDEYP